MIRALNTLAARTILISLLGIAAVHAVSLWVYERALERERAGAQEVRIADRLVSIKPIGVPPSAPCAATR
jgi:two-component system, OmpR family, sensor kinase